MNHKKILYSVQATGNGHISRAIVMLPFLQKYGEVHVFLSGNNSTLNADLPVKYSSRGLSMYYKKSGGINYWKTLLDINIFRIVRDIYKLPVNDYDIVITDYEFICSMACWIKGKRMIHMGHQASFASKKVSISNRFDPIGKWVMRNYCRSIYNIGFHFDTPEEWIFPPIIKSQLWEDKPTDKKYVTIYLPQFQENEYENHLKKISNIQFQIFSKERHSEESNGNLSWNPISHSGFSESMLHCHGIITGAGFETPAEGLFLGKKLLLIPIRNQIEQYTNAEAAEKFGATVIENIDSNFSEIIQNWYEKDNSSSPKIEFETTEIIIDKAMKYILNKFD